MDTGTSGGSDGANIDNVRVQPLGKLFDWSGGASRSPLIVDQSGNGIDGLAEGRIQKIGGHWPRELRGKRSTAGYLIADEKVLPGGHLIKAIYAYSEAGGNLTVGDGPSTDAANIVASATLAAATWTDLDLLKHSSSTRKLHMTPTATTKLVVELIETPEFP
jgi:hypothetical protein